MITALQHLKTTTLEIIRIGFINPDQDWYRVYERGKPAKTVNVVEALRLANEVMKAAEMFDRHPDDGLEFVPDDMPDEEEAKQYAANLTDRYPQLAKRFNGRTWAEILEMVGYRTK